MILKQSCGYLRRWISSWSRERILALTQELPKRKEVLNAEMSSSSEEPRKIEARRVESGEDVDVGMTNQSLESHEEISFLRKDWTLTLVIGSQPSSASTMLENG